MKLISGERKDEDETLNFGISVCLPADICQRHGICYRDFAENGTTAILNGMTLKRKIGQMLMPAFQMWDSRNVTIFHRIMVEK